MMLARGLAGLAAACLAGGTALAAVLGWIGALWGWADAVNHFAPVWLVLAVLAVVLALVGLEDGARRAVLTAAILAILAWGGPIAFELRAAARERTPGPPTLTILSFNRWWDTPHSELEVAAIRASGADLVALQEANGFEAAAQGLVDLYPHQFFCSPGCDTAILSKRPFLAKGRGGHDGLHKRGNFLWAQVEAPDGRPMTLVTTHLYWPIPPWIQRGQRERTVEMIKGFAGEDLVLTGDFNLTPWSFAMRGFDRSLAPLTRRSHGLMTWPATAPLPFLALDEVFATPVWKTVAIRRLPRAGSDHYPVLIQLRR